MKVIDVEIRNEELRQLCNVHKGAYDCSNYYGIGFWLKKHANYPSTLPVCFHCDHGPSISENLLEFELLSKYKKALFHNSLKLTDAKKRKFKEAYSIGAPFVHYRRMMAVDRSDNQIGTVCFPFHSTINIDVVADWGGMLMNLNRCLLNFIP